jgi:hypothetical protein
MGTWPSNGILKHECYTLLLAFLLCGECFGTTVVFISTQGQIFAGTDRLALTDPPQTIRKIALLKGRFIVASGGIESVTEAASHKLLYNFIPWIHGIEAQISPDTSISGLADILEKESSHIFRDVYPIEARMKDGTLKQGDVTGTLKHDVTLVRYVIGGFDNGVATNIEVYYETDWKDNRLVGPMRRIELLEQCATSGIYWFGRISAIEQTKNSQSYAYKRMQVLAPLAYKKLLAGTKLQPQDGIRLIRALISIETEAEPNYVGRGSTVVVLPFKGTGSVTKYEDSLH